MSGFGLHAGPSIDRTIVRHQHLLEFDKGVNNTVMSVC